VAVRLHLEAGLEHVLDDPEPLLLLHLDHLEEVAAPDLDEGQLVGTDVDGGGRRLGERRHRESLSLGKRFASSRQALRTLSASASRALRKLGAAMLARVARPRDGTRTLGAGGRDLRW